MSVCLQVTSVGVRAALSPPVKREELFYIDNGTVDDQHADSSVQETRTHTVPETQTAAPGGGGGRVLTSSSSSSAAAAGDKHVHQCVYCTQSFKSKGELDRHIKTTHVMPTTSQKCNICDEVFPSAAVLAEHKLTHCKVRVT